MDNEIREALRCVVATVQAWDAESPSASHQRDLAILAAALTDRTAAIAAAREAGREEQRALDAEAHGEVVARLEAVVADARSANEAWNSLWNTDDRHRPFHAAAQDALTRSLARLDALATIVTEPLTREDARRAVVRGCERHGYRCRDWHTYPYNVCLGCIAHDNEFYGDKYEAAVEPTDGLIGYIDALEAERTAHAELVARHAGLVAAGDKLAASWPYDYRLLPSTSHVAFQDAQRELVAALDAEATS